MAIGQHRSDERQLMYTAQPSTERSVTGLGLDFDSVGKGSRDCWWDAMPVESSARFRSTDESEYNSLGLSVASVQASAHVYSYLATSSHLRYSSNFDDNPKFEQSNSPNIKLPDLRNRCLIELFPELNSSTRDATGRLQSSETQLKEFGFDVVHSGFPLTPDDELDYASGWSSPYSTDHSTPSLHNHSEPQAFIHVPTPPASAGDAPSASPCPSVIALDSPSPAEAAPFPETNTQEVQPKMEDASASPSPTPSDAKPATITPSLLQPSLHDQPTFFWSVAELEFYPISSRTELSAFDEIVSFPRECFTTGEVRQDNPYPITNAFIREQRCFGNCKFNFRNGAVKPVRLRAHFASCEPRKEYFSELGVLDGFAKACSLQLDSLRFDRSQIQLGLTEDGVVSAERKESTPRKRRASAISADSAIKSEASVKRRIRS